MNKKLLEVCIRDLYESGDLSLSSLQKKYHYKLLTIIETILELIVDFLTENRNIDLVPPLLNLIRLTILKENRTFEASITVKLAEIKNILEEKVREVEKHNREELEYFRDGLDVFGRLNEAHKSKQNRGKIVENINFEYIWTIIESVQNVELIKSMISTYSQFASSCDRNNRSLSFNLIKKYLEGFDEYYLSLLAIAFETRGLKFDEKELEEIEGLIRESSKTNEEEVSHLKALLDHYIKRTGYQNIIYNRFHAIEHSPEILRVSDVSLEGRVDLTSIKTCTFTEKEKRYALPSVTKQITVSLDNNGDYYELYFHLPDLERRFDEFSRAAHLRETISSEIPLFVFQDSSISSFRIGEIKPAITFKLRLSPLGALIKTEVFHSLIKCDYVFSPNTYLNRIKANRIESIDKVIDFCKMIYDQCLSDKDPLDLVEFLEDLLERSITFMTNQSLPFVYRIQMPAEPKLKKEDMEEVRKLAGLYWNRNGSERIIRGLSNYSPTSVVYSPTLLLSMRKSRRLTVPIANPEISFVALRNLQMIKDILIDRCKDREYYFLNAHTESIISNATDKKILLSPKKKCYLRLI